MRVVCELIVNRQTQETHELDAMRNCETTGTRGTQRNKSISPTHMCKYLFDLFSKRHSLSRKFGIVWNTMSTVT